MTQKRLWPLPALTKEEDVDDWPTPLPLFRQLATEFNLEIDVCANAGNTKLPRFFDRTMDALQQPWAPLRVWCNPPYGRETGKWTMKAVEEAARGALVVMLLPAWTDRAWFHDHILPFAEVRWIRKRVAFTAKGAPPPWPCFVAIFYPNGKRPASPPASSIENPSRSRSTPSSLPRAGSSSRSS